MNTAPGIDSGLITEGVLPHGASAQQGWGRRQPWLCIPDAALGRLVEVAVGLLVLTEVVVLTLDVPDRWAEDVGVALEMLGEAGVAIREVE